MGLARGPRVRGSQAHHRGQPCNNPSATLVPPAALRRLAEAIPGVLVVDEAYVDFGVREGTGESMLPLLREHPNLVVLRTFSKSYSLAGARLGFLFAATSIVKELEKVKRDSYNVNALTQALGIAALQDRAYHDELVDKTLAEKARLRTALAERRLDLACFGGELSLYRSRAESSRDLRRSPGGRRFGAVLVDAGARHQAAHHRGNACTDGPLAGRIGQAARRSLIGVDGP